MNIPLFFAAMVLFYFDNPFSSFVFFGLIGVTNGLCNVLGSSTWAEIYGVKYIGSIKALTTALMVFATAFGTAVFGILIDKGFSPESIRYTLLSTHYRQPINFTNELLDSSQKQLNKIYSSLNLRTINEETIVESIPKSLLDDMNTPLAISEIHELVKKLNDKNLDDKEWLKNKNLIKFYGELMGLFVKKSSEWSRNTQKKISETEKEEIQKLIKERNLARQNGNYELADKIREKLRKKGIILEDREKTTNWKIDDG